MINRIHYKALILSILLFCGACICHAEGKWNDNYIEWQDFATGIALAKAHSVPVMLIFHSEYCGACQDYQKIFYSRDVVELSGQLVMILLDDGKEAELSMKFREDGGYVPRTYFLSSGAELMGIEIGAEGTRFRYYLGNQPASVLIDAMKRAIALSE